MASVREILCICPLQTQQWSEEEKCPEVQLVPEEKENPELSLEMPE